MDIEDIFYSETNAERKVSAAQKYIDTVESEHQGILSETQLSQKEDLENAVKETKKLEAELHRYKNVKGFSAAIQKANLERSKKRLEIRGKIRDLAAKIEDLKMEIEGGKHWKEGSLSKDIEKNIKSGKV